MWGPAQTESVTGHLHYVSFTDDFSHETKFDFLAPKSKTLSVSGELPLTYLPLDSFYLSLSLFTLSTHYSLLPLYIFTGS
jgi:hypothetical protein